MKKNFVILSLLSLMPFLGATESSPTFMQVGQGPMQPEYQWYAAPMTRTVDSEVLASMKINTLNQTINAILDKNAVARRFIGLVPDYCGFVFEASSDLKDLDQYRSYLDDVGTFVGKMCSRRTDLESLNVRTEVALRNDGYRREYFLGEVEDTEKKDGIRRYFYSEPTKRPAMWRSLLGFGYTDKRGWLKYAFDKAKLPAAAGIIGYAGYRNQETLKTYGEKALTKGKEYAGKVSHHAKSGAGYVRTKYRNITGATRRERDKEIGEMVLRQEMLQNEQDQNEHDRVKSTFWGLDTKRKLQNARASVANAGRDFTYAPRTIVNQALQPSYERQNRNAQKHETIKALRNEKKQVLAGLNKSPLVNAPGDRPTWSKATPSFEARKLEEQKIKKEYDDKIAEVKAGK